MSFSNTPERRSADGHKNRLATTILITTALVLTLGQGAGAAAAGAPLLQVHDSGHAEIDHVTLTDRDGRWSLYGEVRSPRRSAVHVPGKVGIESLDRDGNRLDRQVASYRHASRHSRYSWFLVDLKPGHDDVATVSVTHLSPFDGE